MEQIKKIKGEIERLKREELTRNDIGVITGKRFVVDVDKLLSFLESLEKEQIEEISPKLPLISQGLDGAAEEYMGTIRQYGDASFTLYADVDVKNGFRAGAEWMEKQGETQEDILHGDADGHPIIRLKYSLRHLSSQFKPGDAVIIQIRKKETK